MSEIPEQHVGTVLAWKFPGVEGIATGQDERTRLLTITEWPDDVLGPLPTETELDRYYEEWQAAGEENKPRPPRDHERIVALERLMVSKGLVTQAELDAGLVSRPRGP